MKNIEYFSSTLTPEGNNSLGDELVIVGSQANEVDPNITNFVSKIETKNSTLTKVVKSSRINPNTEQLSELESKRIALYYMGRDLVKAYSAWDFDIPKKEAAMELVKIFERHGNDLNKISHPKQNSLVGSFLEENSDTLIQTYLTTLAMSEWNVSLTEIHEKYKEVSNEKESYEINKESIDKYETQIPVVESIKNLITYLNGMVLINADNEQWMTIFDNINGIVKRAVVSARMRRSSKNKNDEE